MKNQLNCKDVSRMLSDSQDLSLPAAQRARMRLHLVVCEACRNVNDQFGFLRRAMRQLGEKQEADSAAKK